VWNGCEHLEAKFPRMADESQATQMDLAIGVMPTLGASGRR
jgi:hypothetical protein